MKILNLIKKHPIWTIWIVTFVLYVINGIKTGDPNPAGYLIIGLFLMALFAPFIKRARKKKEDKEAMDYLAKKIAEEQKNSQG